MTSRLTAAVVSLASLLACGAADAGGKASPTGAPSDQALWDLYYSGAAGVKACCAGDQSGCSRMDSVRGALGDWCARGSELGCTLADSLQAEYISCR